MFEAWETFYLLIGTSAAALVGVMFIVTTLTAEIEADTINRGVVIYQNPLVFHLGAIFAASAVILVPDHDIVRAVLLAALGIAGFIYSVRTLLRIFEPYEFYEPTIWDKLFYGFAPCLLYLLLGAGGLASLWTTEFAVDAISATTLVLLVVSIRNAWDVAVFAVRIASQRPAKPKER